MNTTSTVDVSLIQIYSSEGKIFQRINKLISFISDQASAHFK